MTTQPFQDFSFARNTYAKFRPDYPDSVFQEVTKRLKGERNLAVDIGAGTGQASIPLTSYFNKVIAIDPSPGMLQQVSSIPNNLEFRQGSAEKIDIATSTVDLIVSAQAVHWFDLPLFFAETKRLLRPQGLLALWGYSLCNIDHPECQKIIQEYYWQTLKGYWPPDREKIDNHYKDIIPINYQKVENYLTSMSKEVDIQSFIGYLTTWSGLNEYKKKNPGKEDPLISVQKRMEEALGTNQKFTLTFPVFMIFAEKE